MKCPKCSYTSFDYLEECKRCGTDLRDTRTLLQIIAVSPEERAPSPPPASEAPAAQEGVTAATAAPASEPEEEEMLADLDFEGSFEDLVEPTSYTEAEGDRAEPSPADEDEELLDLDFGDLFGESEERGRTERPPVSRPYVSVPRSLPRETMRQPRRLRPRSSIPERSGADPLNPPKPAWHAPFPALARCGGVLLLPVADRVHVLPLLGIGLGTAGEGG